MTPRTIRLLAFSASVVLLASAQNEQAGHGWIGEFHHASRQLNALAQATPADKFGWRPAPGVRSVAEVYMHIAIGNYLLMNQAGVEMPSSITVRFKADGEKSITDKAGIIQILKASQDMVNTQYPKAKPQQKAKFFGSDSTQEGIYLRLLLHNHEHMGQAIGYARMIGVVPPWSKPAAQ